MIADILTSTPQNKKALAEKLRTTPREVELMVQQARLDGAAIISDQDGYRLTTDPEEVLACAERLRQRLVSQVETVRSLERTAERMRSGPMVLWR